MLGLEDTLWFFGNMEHSLLAWTELVKKYSGSEDQDRTLGLCGTFLRQYADKMLLSCRKIVENAQESEEGESFDTGEVRGIHNAFKQLSSLSLHCGDTILAIMHQKLADVFNQYVEAMQKRDTAAGRELEYRLGWLINLLASLLEVKNFGSQTSQLEAKEVDSCALVFKLMSDTGTLMGMQGYAVAEYLEVAFVKFCGGFRKDAIAGIRTETGGCEGFVEPDENPYAGLEAVLRISSMGQIADLIFQKLYAFHAVSFVRINNLTLYANNGRIVELALSLLKDIVGESSAARKLLTMPSIRTLLQKHLVPTIMVISADRRSLASSATPVTNPPSTSSSLHWCSPTNRTRPSGLLSHSWTTQSRTCQLRPALRT